MLDPEYILRLSEGAEQIASELHENIIAQIVKRIMIRLGRGDGYILTPQDKYQLEVLQEAGYLSSDLQAEIASQTEIELEEMIQAFEDAGVRAIAYDSEIYERAGLYSAPLKQSPQLVRLMQRNYEATAGEWRNYTRTTAQAAQRLFIRECDKAYNLVSSGAQSYTRAVRQAVETIASEGVTVTYPSGHTDTIETATLRAVRTGVNQACSEITKARMEELGWDIVLVSAHIGARVTPRDDYTNHSWWQGKFYSLSGNDKRFPPYSVCGDGDVQGIHGANCRHSMGPGDGENNPYEGLIDSEENRKAYELSQRQRALERRIRKTKREVMALKTAVDNAQDPAVKAELEQAYQKKALLLQKQNKAYDDFCNEHNLKRLQDRLAIAKWDRKQAAAATRAAKREDSFQDFYRNLQIASNKRKDAGELSRYVDAVRNGSGPLRAADEAILSRLPKAGDWVQVGSADADIYTLGSLTAKTGSEFASFSRGEVKIIVRGTKTTKWRLPEDLARRIYTEQLRWDAHSHPTTINLRPSTEDRNTLKLFTWQKKSRIIDITGKVIEFTSNEFADIDAGRW